MTANIPEGIYSETKVQKIGTMSTSRTQTIVDYYKATRLDDNTMNVQILDMYGDPMPLMEKVPLADFLKRFTFEPDKFQTRKSPGDLATEKAIATAEKHVARKEYNSAEYEFSKALKLDEENVRANFGLGKLYMATGEVEKAATVFSNLSKQDNVLAPENKHFFNELGMELRGLKLYDQAVSFYRKALGLAPNDENLLFNIARACYEKGDKDLTAHFLECALNINPEMEAAKKLKAVLS
ncbi:tetratricopeptide repeat protein [Deltaproteobacteria bacterium OttesenSCG-928-M10]|nr:tetratricopeptide repeat protein [Deltaproteobacteria bacterium OttesenSCG-928-M10]